MTRAGLAATVAGAALLLACGDSHDSPLPCGAIPAPRGEQDLPADTVWGFADLHAHPAIELAFGGRLVWGGAVDDAPVNGAELPRIAPCPVETHEQDATSPLDRAAGTQVFSALAQSVGFAHGPVGSVSGSQVVDAWPNARDVIHQQMNVGSIRRAYEGGLRLMFASTTDDQLLGAVLDGPSFVNGFLPDAGADAQSARRQLDRIVKMAADNSKWMTIVNNPADARRAIGEGRLAIVLALEMNGLREPDVDELVDDFGVSSIIPVHLIDNDVGGTAALGDIFNTSSAAVSELYHPEDPPLSYLSLCPTADSARPLGRPSGLGTFTPLPVYVSPVDVPYSKYESLCYEPLNACSGPGVQFSSFLEFGQRNRRGLCDPGQCGSECAGGPGIERIRHLMDRRLLVDVSHMSAASVRDTLGKVPGKEAYPLIASHGNVARLCDGSPHADCRDDARAPFTERELDAPYAREIVARGGVLGFGTGNGQYAARALLAARGGPLFTVSPTTGPSAVCAAKEAAKGQGTPGCEQAQAVDLAGASMPVRELRIRTIGAVPAAADSGPARPVARIELRGPSPRSRYQRRVVIAPLDCSAEACSRTVSLDDADESTQPEAFGPGCTTAGGTAGTTPYLLDDLESVTLEWLYGACDLDCQSKWGAALAERQCSSTWDDDQAPSWTIEEADLSASSAGEPAAPVAQLGPRDATPIARLGRSRGSIVLYRRDDRPSTALDVPASGHLLKVSLTSSPGGRPLSGASPASSGANVCVAVRQAVGDACLPPPAPLPGATECPKGWVTLNQRGEWAPGVTLSTFVRFPGEESSVCGVDMAVLDWDDQSEPFSVDEVRVEAIEDPVGHWVRRYAAIAREVAGGRLGALAFGTDFNGLNGTTDISEFPRPADALAPAACGEQTAPLPLPPLRFRNSDGSLGSQVLLEERGLATYGLLADMLALIERYPGCGKDVHSSLMLSAEATLRAWEALRGEAKDRPPLPRRPFACGSPWETAP